MSQGSKTNKSNCRYSKKSTYASADYKRVRSALPCLAENRLKEPRLRTFTFLSTGMASPRAPLSTCCHSSYIISSISHQPRGLQHGLFHSQQKVRRLLMTQVSSMNADKARLKCLVCNRENPCQNCTAHGQTCKFRGRGDQEPQTPTAPVRPA
jgi:hypothetical protein